MKIGNILVDPPVILAPMAGTTCMPFRLLCRRAGAGLVCSEMVSANALAYASPRTHELLVTCEGEHPVAIQVFGSDPALVAAAAEVAESAGADIVDINMGCPAKKVLRSGAGAVLLKEPQRAVAIASAVVRAVTVPVTAKIRAGWTMGNDSYLEFARHLADVGVSAITIHGRTASQGYRGKASWDAISRLVEAVPVPVVGNGDVFEPNDAIRMMRETGCAAVMIGRAALGNPFVFRRIARALEGKPSPETPPHWRLAAAIWHAQALVLHYGEAIGIRRMRQQACWYAKGIPNAAHFRQQACRVSSLRELVQAILTLAPSARRSARVASIERPSNCDRSTALANNRLIRLK